jgi:hypothetical protein
MNDPDYYGLLQINPNAEISTIHRVFQFLAARYHPDNPATGNAEKFIQLKQAYDVLADPSLRAKYDREYQTAPSSPPLSTSIDFMDSHEGEMNRRLAVLALLYIQRRTNPFAPEVPLTVVEKRMGFPRDYLDFTTWYLRNKGYIARSDNSDFTLTVDGVDYVESQRVTLPLLNKLLTSGTPVMTKDSFTEDGGFEPSLESGHESLAVRNSKERRSTTRDRRVGAPDLRVMKIERRSNVKDRRDNR